MPFYPVNDQHKVSDAERLGLFDLKCAVIVRFKLQDSGLLSFQLQVSSGSNLMPVGREQSIKRIYQEDQCFSI